MLRALSAGVLVLALLAGSAAAWPLGEGVEVDGGDSTLFTVAPPGLDPSLFTYEAETLGGTLVPCFDGVCLQLKSDDASPYLWGLSAAGPAEIQVSGTPTVAGTFHIFGLASGVYTVQGVYGEPDFNVNGPSPTFTIPAGAQTITITPFGGISSGPRLLLDALWSPTDGQMTCTIVVQDSAGHGVPGLAAFLVVHLVGPGNVSAALLDMAPDIVSGVPGSYVGVANLTQVEMNGTWLVIAEYNGTLASRAVAVGPGPIASGVQGTVELTSSTVDTWVPLAIWGGLFILFVYLLAWAPALGMILNLADTLYTRQTGGVMLGLPGQVFVLIVFLVAHALITRGIIPLPWGKRGSGDDDE